MEIVGTRGQILMAKCTKINFGWGSAPDPAGGAYDAPSDPLVRWGGGCPLPMPYPPRRPSRPLASHAFGCLTELKPTLLLPSGAATEKRPLNGYVCVTYLSTETKQYSTEQQQSFFADFNAISSVLNIILPSVL